MTITICDIITLLNLKHMEQATLMNSHRVMSLVVFVLAVFMILGSAYLSYMQTEFDFRAATIHNAAESKVGQIISARQQALNDQEEPSDDGESEEER